jgi:3-hydroxymyristoyl/3-hydroxydecanoyl-(acyl carrier protein) dehydratase
MDELESTWTVPVDHPAFAGHFPGQPIVPGVVLLDHAIHLAGQWQQRPAATWRVDSAKFFHPVGPGEALCFRLSRKASGALAFKVSEGGRDVASGALTPTDS